MGETMQGFGAYTLESIFQQGADVIVYRARHTATGARALVAVPHMPEEWEEIAPFRDRFIASARQVESLHHPGILDIREIGVDESSGMPFIAYEAVEGTDLRELTVHGRRLPNGDIALLGAAVAEALEHAHSAGFVHGGISPANIIVGEGQTVKLAGFGLVGAAQSPTEMRGCAPGTGAYSSPEQIRGAYVDSRSDLFSLGIVLFELVTGQHPFLAIPPRDVRDRIVADEAPLAGKLRPDLAGGFNSILFKLLQKEPGKRPARASEVALTLRALYARLLQPVAPAPAAPLATQHPPAPRRTRVSILHLAVGGGLLVLAAVIAGVVLLRPVPPAAVKAEAPAAVTSPAQRELTKILDDAEAALAAGDFARAERLLVEARRLDPLNARGLDVAQRARSARDEKVKRLFEQGIAFGKAQRWQDAERSFLDVLAVDPDNVDAKDQLEELHELTKTGRLQPLATPPSSAQPARPAPTPEPPRRLRVYFASPLPAGELALSLERRPFARLPFDAASGGGVIDTTLDMPHGRHQVLIALHNQQGLTLGDQMFVLDFEAGRTFQITVEMSGPRVAPRFSAAELH
jgi:tRNA A-37 threonylcarbamoyl transferase component Bud32